MSMRIGIIGVGAIGGVVGGMLTKAGHDVTLIDQWPEHVEAMKDQIPAQLVVEATPEGPSVVRQEALSPAAG